MTTKTFDVPKVHCDGCVRTVTKALAQLPGVAKVEASAVTKQVQVEFDPSVLDETRLREALAAAGYPVV